MGVIYATHPIGSLVLIYNGCSLTSYCCPPNIVLGTQFVVVVVVVVVMLFLVPVAVNHLKASLKSLKEEW